MVPNELVNKTFLSKTAGSFSGVPQRTVQAWTEKGLVVSLTSGSGDKRHYSVLNCIEIAVIKNLASDRMAFPIIAQVMEALRDGCPQTLNDILKYSNAYLIIRYYTSGNIGVACASDEFFGSRNKIEPKKGRTFNQFWQDATIPKDLEHAKTLAVNLKLIANNVVEKIR